ncbi:SH2 domain-containing protein 1A-like [Gouania willdenowi]|uniref:SH2 domain-containing protein 1A-like n=1 Tax=Gouania willdenowi TaxID=441366 RepID=UPI0010549FAE|nr:SH2 domain-containing protein 1A-like [Gouania willdenowi]
MESEGLLVRSIYYGAIGQEAAEKLLQRFGRDGSFLLRDSRTMEGAFCLCVRKTPFVHTYRLLNSADGWYMPESEVPLPRFRTLESLIETYRRAPFTDVSMPRLTDPLEKTQLQNRLDPGFSYMEMNSNSSVY